LISIATMLSSSTTRIFTFDMIYPSKLYYNLNH
jgi:hypothetical protein